MTTDISSFSPSISNTGIFSTPLQTQKGVEKIKTDERALSLQESPSTFSPESLSIVFNSDASMNNTNMFTSRFSVFTSSFMNPTVENNTQRSTASTSNIIQVAPPIFSSGENFLSNNSSPMSFSTSFTSLSSPSAQDPYETPFVLFKRATTYRKKYNEERAKLLFGIPRARIVQPPFFTMTPEISPVKTTTVSQSMLSREALRPKQRRHAFRNLSESFAKASNSKAQRSGFFENIQTKFSSSLGNFSPKTAVQS